MAKTHPEDLDWNKLGFKYHDLPYRWVDEFKDGKWQGGHLTQDSSITFNEAAEELHYGQEVFEGLKAYRRKDDGINLFRPEQNAKRMANSAKRLLMEPYPEDEFIKAVKGVVKANQDFVPPYGSGGTLYIRPFMMGMQPIVGVSPSETYQFRIYATPVGAYIKGLKPMPYEVSDYDRAAPAGTGQAKTAGNYASSLMPRKMDLRMLFIWILKNTNTLMNLVVPISSVLLKMVNSKHLNQILSCHLLLSVQF